MLKRSYGYSSESGADTKVFDFVGMVRSVAVAYVMSIVLLVLTALVATIQSMSDKGIGIMVKAVTAICVVLCGFISGRRAQKGGLLIGASSGMLYTLLLYLIGSLFSGSFVIGINAISVQIIGLVCGATGGIVGINTRKNKRR